MCYFCQRAGITSLPSHSVFLCCHPFRSQLAWLGKSTCFVNFLEAMEGLKLHYNFHLNEEAPAAYRDFLQPSHPIDNMHETNRDRRREGLVSAIEDEEIFPDTNTTMLRPTASMLDDREGQLEEVKNSDNASVMEQADRIGQINLESKDLTISKTIRSYLDESLPDLLRSGSPLRRRVSSPVSDTVRYYLYNS